MVTIIIIIVKLIITIVVGVLIILIVIIIVVIIIIIILVVIVNAPGCVCDLQVQRLGIWGAASFCWACFKWFFSAGATMINSVEVPCNTFDMFPSLGLKVRHTIILVML